MKKTILLSLITITGLWADMMTDMAKDAALSKVKSEARATAIETVAGGDAAKEEMANKVADKVLGKEDPVDNLKAKALDAVMDTNASKETNGSTDTNMSVPGATDLLENVAKDAVKEPSLEDKALDMAAEKVVGSNPLEKEAVKSVVKDALK